MASAAVRFRPMMMMWALPLVYRAKASAMPWPMPAVPPTNTATGMYEGEKLALNLRAAGRRGMVGDKRA
jgi:hypothetical protein